jgi:hypothetical protein
LRSYRMPSLPRSGVPCRRCAWGWRRRPGTFRRERRGHVPRARCPAISLCVYRRVILAVRTRARPRFLPLPIAIPISLSLIIWNSRAAHARARVCVPRYEHVSVLVWWPVGLMLDTKAMALFLSTRLRGLELTCSCSRHTSVLAGVASTSPWDGRREAGSHVLTTGGWVILIWVPGFCHKR